MPLTALRDDPVHRLRGRVMDAADMLDGPDGIDEARWEQAMMKRRRTRKSDDVPQWMRDLSKRTVKSARKDNS